MKKLFTIGFVVSSIAVSMVACTKNDSINPTSNTKGTFGTSHLNIAIKDTVTPPRNFTSIKKDTVTPPHLNIAIKDTVTPPARILYSPLTSIKKDTVTPPHVVLP